VTPSREELSREERRSLDRMAASHRRDDRLRRGLGLRDAASAVGPTADYVQSLLAARPSPEADTDRLAAAARRGDRAAREALVERLLPRIVALARRYAGGESEFADLVQEGVVWLLEALTRFDPERGTPFWAYAALWVQGGIARLARDQRRAVRLPAAALSDLSALKEAAAEIEAAGSTATLAAVAERAGMDIERARAILSADRPAQSLDRPIEGEDGLLLRDVIPDAHATAAYDDVLRDASRPELRSLLGALTRREREVIERRFGLGGRTEETLREVASRMGVSRERVRQIEARALNKLATAAGA
jgi:RNA polymerase primary sigma factor